MPPANSDLGTVLVVEDEDVSRHALVCLLNAAGYIAEAANSGEEAMNLLHNGTHPWMAVVDFDLPGMNGLEFIQLMVQHDPEVRSILVTATSLDRIQQLRARYSFRYMQKPLDPAVLLEVLTSQRQH